MKGNSNPPTIKSLQLKKAAINNNTNSPPSFSSPQNNSLRVPPSVRRTHPVKQENNNVQQSFFFKEGQEVLVSHFGSAIVKSFNPTTKTYHVYFPSFQGNGFIREQDVSPIEKIFLILDLNGVLVKRSVFDATSNSAKRSYTKRKHCNEFLDFAFRNFNVAVWSCGKKQGMELEIFNQWRSQLAFVKSQDDSLNLWPLRSVVAEGKPLFVKDLNKLFNEIRCLL